MLNVVSLLDASFHVSITMLCVNFNEHYIAFARQDSTSSIMGVGNLSHFNALFRCWESIQILSCPEAFVTTTMLLTQSVCSSTGVNRPRFVSLSNSILILDSNTKFCINFFNWLFIVRYCVNEFRFYNNTVDVVGIARIFSWIAWA